MTSGYRGPETIEDWLVDGPLELSDKQGDDVAERIREQGRGQRRHRRRGALTGALLLIEVIAAVLAAIVVVQQIESNDRSDQRRAPAGDRQAPQGGRPRFLLGLATLPTQSPPADLTGPAVCGASGT